MFLKMLNRELAIMNAREHLDLLYVCFRICSNLFGAKIHSIVFHCFVTFTSEVPPYMDLSIFTLEAMPSTILEAWETVAALP